MAMIRGGNNIMKTLGQMVGLLIGLYVFDQIIAVVMPLAANCSGGSANYNASDTTDLCTSGPATGGGNFVTSLLFIKSLWGVVGIIGTFEIVYRGLKRSGLV